MCLCVSLSRSLMRDVHWARTGRDALRGNEGQTRYDWAYDFLSWPESDVNTCQEFDFLHFSISLWLLNLHVQYNTVCHWMYNSDTKYWIRRPTDQHPVHTPLVFNYICLVSSSFSQPTWSWFCQLTTSSPFSEWILLWAELSLCCHPMPNPPPPPPDSSANRASLYAT